MSLSIFMNVAQKLSTNKILIFSGNLCSFRGQEILTQSNVLHSTTSLGNSHVFLFIPLIIFIFIKTGIFQYFTFLATDFIFIVFLQAEDINL